MRGKGQGMKPLSQAHTKLIITVVCFRHLGMCKAKLNLDLYGFSVRISEGLKISNSMEQGFFFFFFVK